MTARWIRWPEPTDLADGSRSAESATPRMAYGADYNPEQWPEEVWADDVRLMREAGVNIVSVGIFSWALLQPTADSWDFGWLDRALDLLHSNGIAVDLATATASPPPWLTTLHPEILPVTRTGETLWPGARQQWRPTSPVFREYALTLVTTIAERYANHPALAMWHVNNELGCHNIYDYSDDAAAAFRRWLEARYGTLAELNRAWGTAFWSQNYSQWTEILPPRLAAANPNPTQQLDFTRFSSDALREYLIAERDILHRITPDVPVTTNFMIMSETKGMDYVDWASQVDVVSNDHYLLGDDPLAWQDLSFSASLTGNLTGDPWFLMEHSTSAVNWQRVNLAKSPGAMRRDSLTHVAHGADAVCFFQWRQSQAGAEKFHSAMVPHAGENSAVFRDVVGLGADLAALSEVVGSRPSRGQVAILFDWNSWWASELDSHPSSELNYKRAALEWYTAAINSGLEVDVLPATSTITDFDHYAVVIAPMLYLAPEGVPEALEAYARRGGHLVVSFFSGIADRDDHVYPGGYPGAFRDLLGVRVEEFGPVFPETILTLDNGFAASLWSENVAVEGDVEVLARFVDGPFPGVPALTRRAVGAGSASYAATSLDAAALTALVGSIAERAGISSRLESAVHGRVEIASRETADTRYTFLLNHAAQPIMVTGIDGLDLLTGTESSSGVVLPVNGVAIVRQSKTPEQTKTGE
jgi:beta-galactosidase